MKKYTLEQLNQMVAECGESCSLDLSSLTSIPEGFNPTVGGYLDLSSDLKVQTRSNCYGRKLERSGWIRGKG